MAFLGALLGKLAGSLMKKFSVRLAKGFWHH